MTEPLDYFIVIHKYQPKYMAITARGISWVSDPLDAKHYETRDQAAAMTTHHPYRCAMHIEDAICLSKVSFEPKRLMVHIKRLKEE